MKKTAFLLTSILFTVLFFSSCSSTKKINETPQNVIINIEAKNLPEQKAFLTDSKKNVYAIEKINNGQFIDTLEVPAGYYSIHIGNEYSNVYLKPGMNLHINVDGKQFDESIHYEGKGKEINNYLAQEMLHDEQMKKKLSPPKLVALPEKDFLQLVDSVYQQNIKRLKDSDIKDKDFVYLQSKKYQVDKNTLHYYYPIYKTYVLKKTYKTGANYPKPLEGLDINDSRLIQLPGYIELVKSSLSSGIDEESLKKDYMLALMKSAEDKLKSNKDLMEVVMINLAKSGMSSTKNLTEFYDIFYRNVKDSTQKSKIEKTYHNLLKLQPGNPSPDFKAYDINGKEYHLSDFKGKNVYIDLWATWCGPCLAEVPSLEKLKKDYEGKNIEFVSIDVYDNKDKWEKMVKSGKITGVQLRIPERDAKFLELYDVRGIPRFIFIDKDGKIIDNNVSRPSNPATRELIDKYVSE